MFMPSGIVAASGLGIIVATDENISEVSLSPSNARAGYQAQLDGNVIAVKTINADIGDWLLPKYLAPGDYQVRCAPVGDTVSGDPINTWVNASEAPFWFFDQVGTGSKSATLTIDYRKGAGAILKTITATIYAEVTL